MRRWLEGKEGNRYQERFGGGAERTFLFYNYIVWNGMDSDVIPLVFPSGRYSYKCAKLFMRMILSYESM